MGGKLEMETRRERDVGVARSGVRFAAGWRGVVGFAGGVRSVESSG